jgi:hypothetical protein
MGANNNRKKQMKTEFGEEQHLFVCDCNDLSHQFIVSWYPDDDRVSDEMFITVHLAQSLSFWQRLWAMLKYVFGYRSCFGDFDSINLNTYRAKKLVEVLNRFLAKNEAKNK